MRSTENYVIDNESDHKLTAEAKEVLKSSNTVVSFLRKNGSGLCQQADSFIIQKRPSDGGIGMRKGLS